MGLLSTARETTPDKPTTDPGFSLDYRSYCIGLLFGALTLVLLLGVLKDGWALVKPSGRGQLIFGFLMVRYTSLERVWLGYRFCGSAA